MNDDDVHSLARYKSIIWLYLHYKRGTPENVCWLKLGQPNDIIKKFLFSMISIKKVLKT